LGRLEVKRGDVVLMIAPRELGRPRPGIVVQADELETGASTLLICPLSTDIRFSPRLRPVIEPTEQNGLRARSQVMTDKIGALRHDRIRATLGRIDSETTERIDRALMIVLGLAK
jgi:mRNA interferase MazF